VCGFAGNEFDSALDLPGDRLVIDRARYTLRRPQRWELIALRDPTDPAQVLVKRVVGLPGENVQIRGGDVYINGQIASKSLGDLRQQAVLVDDVRFRSRDGEAFPPHWQPESISSPEAATAWRPLPQGFVLEQPLSADAGPRWLSFRPWRREPGSIGRRQPWAIHDDFGYNQVRPRRAEDSRLVSDLMLTCLVEASSDASLWLRARWPKGKAELRLDLQTGSLALTYAGKTVPADSQLPEGLFSRPTELALAICDQRLLLEAGGQPLMPPYPLAPEREAGGTHSSPESHRGEVPEPLQIGGLGTRVVVKNLQVWRDVYYTCPRPASCRGCDQPCVLGPDEYYVLGDNTVESRDSRHWPQEAPVRGEYVMGRPVLAWSAAEPAILGPLRIPRWENLRYIR
jgi:signal peptidase I